MTEQFTSDVLSNINAAGFTDPDKLGGFTVAVLAGAAIYQVARMFIDKKQESVEAWLWLIMYTGIGAMGIGAIDYTDFLPKLTKGLCNKSGFVKRTTIVHDGFSAIKCLSEKVSDKLFEDVNTSAEKTKVLTAEAKLARAPVLAEYHKYFCENDNRRAAKASSLGNNKINILSECYKILGASLDKIGLATELREGGYKPTKGADNFIPDLFLSLEDKFRPYTSAQGIISNIILPVLSYVKSIAYMMINMTVIVMTVLSLIFLTIIMAFMPIDKARSSIYSAVRNTYSLAIFPLVYELVNVIGAVLTKGVSRMLDGVTDPGQATFVSIALAASVIIQVALIFKAPAISKDLMNLSLDGVAAVATSSLQIAALLSASTVPFVGQSLATMANRGKERADAALRNTGMGAGAGAAGAGAAGAGLLSGAGGAIGRRLAGGSPNANVGGSSFAGGQNFDASNNYGGPRGMEHFPQNKPPSAKLSQKQIDGLNSSDPVPGVEVGGLEDIQNKTKENENFNAASLSDQKKAKKLNRASKGFGAAQSVMKYASPLANLGMAGLHGLTGNKGAAFNSLKQGLSQGNELRKEIGENRAVKKADMLGQKAANSNKTNAYDNISDAQVRQEKKRQADGIQKLQNKVENAQSKGNIAQAESMQQELEKMRSDAKDYADTANKQKNNKQTLEDTFDFMELTNSGTGGSEASAQAAKEHFGKVADIMKKSNLNEADSSKLANLLSKNIELKEAFESEFKKSKNTDSNTKKKLNRDT